MPKVKHKSKQYLFRNKLNKRLKSQKELIIESFFMMLFGLFLLLINYSIPQKKELFSSFRKNILEILVYILKILSNFFEILKVLLICFTLLLSIFLIVGSINRLIKVLLPRSRKIRFR